MLIINAENGQTRVMCGSICVFFPAKKAGSNSLLSWD